MTTTKEKLPFWVDCVHGKHECYSYDKPGFVAATVNGRNVKITVPSYLAVQRWSSGLP